MFTGPFEFGEENDCHRMGAPANSMWVYLRPFGKSRLNRPIVYADSSFGHGTGEGLWMVTARMSKSGKCLPLFACLRPKETPMKTLISKGLSPVFHIPRHVGTPLAFTVVDEVQ